MIKEDIKEIHKFTSEEKMNWWGYGEWLGEPDEVDFTYNAINCKILRIAIKEPYSVEEHIFGGHLCGYVQIPKDNILYLDTYEDMDIDCHGGLTYGEIIDKKYWIGFDCAHSTDFVPSTEQLCKNNLKGKKIHDSFKEFYNKIGVKDCLLFNPTYKNINFCINECKSIVDQIIDLKF